MSFKATPAQQKAIDCRTNCVVSAGAGSGKTGVLSERFARLVADGQAHCDQILTLTFTRKATSEMKSRIYKKLVDLNMPEELDRFANASISTVDSLCAAIARSDCRRFGIAADFNVMDPEDFKREVQNLALGFLTNKASDPSLAWLLKFKSPQAIMEMLAKCESDVLDITCQPDPLVESRYEEGRILTIREQILADLSEYCTMYLDRLSDDDKLEVNIKTINRFLNGEISHSEIIFTAAKGKKDNQEISRDLKNKIKACLEKLKILEDAVENQENIAGVYALVCEFHRQVNSYRRSSNVLMFKDVMAMTLDILTNKEEIRQQWKEKFSFIMIDEFQDNNDDYRKLLYLLAQKYDDHTNKVPQPEDLERGKIFLVGDQKQSIYGFRGADVSVFKRMETEIKKSDGCLIELDTNFRSNTALVKAFNSIFSRIMANDSMPWEAKFKDLSSPEGKDESSRIMFHYYDDPFTKEKKPDDMTDQYQSEAIAIAQLIEEMTGTDKWLVNGRRPQPDDIAILLRGTAGQGNYEKALRLANIPYTTKETRALTQEALVNDFYNALQLCLYPYDTISQEAYDRSPLSGQSLDGLKEVVRSSSCTKAVSYIWNNMGYRYFIITNPANQVYEEYYSYLFSMAVTYDQNGEGLVGLLDYLRPMLGKNSKLRQVKVLLEQSLGVQIMTIHASKGLQFPIVIVAGMNGGNDGYKVAFEADNHDGHLDLPFVEQATSNGRRIVRLDDALNSKRLASIEEAETMRIFYVAATRAENHIVFSTSIPEEKKDPGDTSERTMAKMLLDSCPFDVTSKQFIKPEDSFFEVRAFTSVPISRMWSSGRLTDQRRNYVGQWYKAQPDEFDLAEGRIAVTQLTHTEVDIESTPEAQRLPSIKSDDLIREKGLQTAFGTYVHTLIEDAICKRPGQRHFESTVLTPEQTAMVEQDASELAGNFINSARFTSMKDLELHSERSFMLWDDETSQVVEGAIDLYGVGEDYVQIVDFKTDLYRIPQIHQGQLDLYSRAIQSIYPDKKVNSAVVYLRLKG